MVGRAMRRDGRAVRQQLAGVIEDHYAIAEQAPALLRVADHGVGRLAVRCLGIRAWRRVRAHSRASCVSLSRLDPAVLATPAHWPRPLTLTLPRRMLLRKQLA